MTKRKSLNKRLKESHRQRELKKQRHKQAQQSWSRWWLDFNK